MTPFRQLFPVPPERLSPLATRVAIPLHRVEWFGPPARRLDPVVEIQGERLILATAELAGLPLKALGEKATSLQKPRGEIVVARDRVISGV
ncbi:MAG: CcdB family protein [Magnetococcales bacterium]|nr:CcdB family protein [Magnetococcales bacterium]